MGFLDFVVLVVPAAVGIVSALKLGPTRGTLFGALIMMIAVIVLLMFQVTIPASAPGAEVGRAGFAWGLFLFEWYRWFPAFLIGAAIGSLLYRRRRGRITDQEGLEP